MSQPGPGRSSRRAQSALAAILLLSLPLAITATLLALRLHFQPPTVPPYVLEEPGPIGTGAHGDRRDDGSIAVVRGQRFALSAQPEGAVVGAVAARGFLVREGQVRPWDPPFVVARDGAIAIAGPVDALFAGVPDGPWEIGLAVGRPETLPTAPRDILRAGGDAGVAAWRLLRERIRLVAAPTSPAGPAGGR